MIIMTFMLKSSVPQLIIILMFITTKKLFFFDTFENLIPRVVNVMITQHVFSGYSNYNSSLTCMYNTFLYKTHTRVNMRIVSISRIPIHTS